MEKVLHQNSKGIKMIREDFRHRSQVRVVSTTAQKYFNLRTYRFNFIHEPVEVPYCSWANLDCCGGWSFDEEYLDTAVQKGLKLFAGRTTSLKHQYAPNNPTLEEARKQFKDFQASLPAGVFADAERGPSQTDCFYTFVCRTGKISDHIDMDMVFGFYDKLGQNISSAEKKEVEHLCGLDIKVFGTDQAPFRYTRASTNAEFITTGLLLGYPIESTVSILQGY